MKYIFSNKNTNVADAEKNYAQKKLAKFERFFKDEAEANIIFSSERNRYTVEITIFYKSMIFRSSGTTQDMRASIDSASDAIFRQIHKNKTRLEKRFRQGAFDKGTDAEDIEIEAILSDSTGEEESYDIVRTKRFAIKPESPDEAILQMNMLNHQFYIFRDETNGDAVSVVYRRNDGGYGIIEAE